MQRHLQLGVKLRALAAIMVLPVILEFMSFRRVQRILDGVRPGRRRKTDFNHLNRWVSAVLRRLPGPWRYTCLRRAVVMAYLLRRGSVRVVLHVGVSRRRSGKLSAHAWLTLDGRPFLEANPLIIAGYREITRVSGPRPRMSRLLVRTLGRSAGDDQAALREAWETGDLRGLADLVRFEGSELWLYRRLKTLNLNKCWWKKGFGGRLAREARRIAATNLLIDEETVVSSRILHNEGIQFVLLKGAARRACRELYELADTKETCDVDILVPADQVDVAWKTLKRAGYEYSTDPAATPAGHYHRPPLQRNGVAVELHTSTALTLSPEDAWVRMNGSSKSIGLQGVCCRVPDATELLWHAVTHALEHGSIGFSLRYFLDAVSVAASGETVDWSLLRERLDHLGEEERRLSGMWLTAVDQLAGTIPRDLLEPRWSYDLERMLDWRLAVLRRTRMESRFREKLLYEGIRAAIGIGLTRVVPRTPLRHKIRRKVSAILARASYFVWNSAVATRLRTVDTQ